jgi:hypothetical protein
MIGGFLMILLATSTVLIPIGLNQNQIAMAQQQKLQGFQNKIKRRHHL